ncbi:MAG: hypothetical protein J2P36_17085, partial [Ktedonobacteraceae bacterium]|nr:hypothetical protein [Ktedonobacteraceae bacterium]
MYGKSHGNDARDFPRNNMITNQASPALQQKKRPARSIIKALLILGTALVVGFGFSKVLSMPG